MSIDKRGHYLTHGGYQADVYVIRGAYCIGWITLQDGSRKTGMWRIEQGTIMGGTPDDDLVELVRPFEEPAIQ
jgi:hypothetical protein